MGGVNFTFLRNNYGIETCNTKNEYSICRIKFINEIMH